MEVTKDQFTIDLERFEITMHTSVIRCSSATDSPRLLIGKKKREKKRSSFGSQVHTDMGKKPGDKRRHTHSLGFRNTSSITASRDPLAGSCMYSHLREREGAGYWATAAHCCSGSSGDALLLPGGEGERHQDALDPGAGRGQAKLHSPVVHQVELHISAAQSQTQVISNAASSHSITEEYSHSQKNWW